MRVLNIDLSSGNFITENISQENQRKFIGGRGLGAKILFDKTNANTEPLGPDNCLIFMTGPLINTRVPTSGRHAVVTKSPLTGIYTESDVGGSWGVTLKKAGYDGIVVTGKSEKPVYLWVDEQKIEIRNASHVWGVDTYKIEEILREETKSNSSVLAIGPAGEKMVRIASILTDGKHARAAGCAGVGAVMGSKNLKAIVPLVLKKHQ